jgi:hypothetical protein
MKPVVRHGNPAHVALSMTFPNGLPLAALVRLLQAEGTK